MDRKKDIIRQKLGLDAIFGPKFRPKIPILGRILVNLYLYGYLRQQHIDEV